MLLGGAGRANDVCPGGVSHQGKLRHRVQHDLCQQRVDAVAPPLRRERKVAVQAPQLLESMNVSFRRIQHQLARMAGLQTLVEK